MIPPLDIGFEIGHQLFWRREDVGFLSFPKMPMIAFSALIVVTQDTVTTNNVGESILEVMARRHHGAWHPPDHDLNERIHRGEDSSAKQ